MSQSDAKRGATPSERRVGSSVLRALRRASVVGLLVAVVVHIAVFVIAELIVFTPAIPSASGSGDPGFEFAVMSRAEFAELEERALDASEPEAPMPEQTDPLDGETLEASEPAELSGSLRGLDDLVPTIGGGDLGDGASLGAGGGGGGASFFGVEASGRRFAYVVDTSASMNAFGKWEATSAALLASVSELFGNSEFFIVLFNSDAWPLGGRTEWVRAGERGKTFARREIDGVRPGGSTKPSPAFLEVFSLKPKPDAIYFMTDGEFEPEVAAEIISINRELRVTIHCITFVNDEAAPLMRNIAGSSGGTYTHIPGPQP